MNTHKVLSSLLIGALCAAPILEAASKNAASDAYLARRAALGRGVRPPAVGAAAGGAVAAAPAAAAPVRGDAVAAVDVAELAALRAHVARLIAENNGLQGRAAGVVPVAMPHGIEALHAEIARLTAENAALRAARDRAGGGGMWEALAAGAVGLVAGGAVRAYGDNAALNARVAAAEQALEASRARSAQLERDLAAAPSPAAVAADLAVERGRIAALTAQLAAAQAAAAAVPVVPVAAGGAGAAREPGARDANPFAGIPQPTAVFNALNGDAKARLRGIITFLRGKNEALTPAHEPYALYDDHVIEAFNNFKNFIVNWDAWERAGMGGIPRDRVLGMPLEGDVSFAIRNVLLRALGVTQENLDATIAAVRALIQHAHAVMTAAHPAPAGGAGAGMAVYEDPWGNAVHQHYEARRIRPVEAIIVQIRDKYEGQAVNPRQIPAIVLNDLYDLDAIPDDRPVPVLTTGERAAFLAHMKSSGLDFAARERARANPKVIRKFKEMVQGLPFVAPRLVGEPVRARVEDRDDAPLVEVQLPDTALATLSNNNRLGLNTDLINLYVRIKNAGRPAGGGAAGDGDRGGLMAALRAGTGLRGAQFTGEEKTAVVAELMTAFEELAFIPEDQRTRVAEALVNVGTDRAFVDSCRAAERREEGIRGKVGLVGECWKALVSRGDESNTLENLIMMCAEKELIDSFNALQRAETLATKGTFSRVRREAADRIAAAGAGGGGAAKVAPVAAGAPAAVAAGVGSAAAAAATGSPARAPGSVANPAPPKIAKPVPPPAARPVPPTSSGEPVGGAAATATAAIPPGLGSGAAAAAATGSPTRVPGSAVNPAPPTPSGEPVGGAGAASEAGSGVFGPGRSAEEERVIRAFKLGLPY